MRRNVSPLIVGLLLLAGLATSTRAADAPPLLTDSPGDADVSIVSANTIADVFVDANDYTVVRTAAGLLCEDLNRVTGRQPKLKTDTSALESTAILIGTIGQSPVIDRLIADGKLDVSKVRGQWETFVIATVEQPLSNVEHALVIVGSDRRGTAYGVFELSEQIGVSPWYWWADVPAVKRESIVIKAGTHVVGPPRVKYRGYFINDEDWGLQPWAKKTFEPDLGTIGPKTYAKVFELMLRLKTNYLWPAMHPCTKEFAAVPGNVKTADDWAIVMGASHAEPMNRNNVWYDKAKLGEWRYDTNRENIKKYWEEYARDRGPFEAVWTVGMRGIHDSGMIGPRTVKERADILGQVIRDQRDLLSKYVAKDASTVPQALMPYKEVLEQYQAGLELPEDVTLVWCDDNFGYIRQLSTPAEQKRSGRSGVYYHSSYLGAPKSYLWIDTMPPALAWTEMQRSLAYGADRIWVLNVGDIKSNERATDFWAKLAWNPDRWDANAQNAFLNEWARQNLGADVAEKTTALFNAFYKLNASRKAEHLSTGLFRGSDELRQRVAASHELMRQADAIGAALPSDRQDAWFQLVGYPIYAFSLTTQAMGYADLSVTAAKQYRTASANAYALASRDAMNRIQAETDRYNHGIAKGKWDGIMNIGGFGFAGEYTNWERNWAIPFPKADLDIGQPSGESKIGVLIDGRHVPLIDGQPAREILETVQHDWPIAEQVSATSLLKPWAIIRKGEVNAIGVPAGAGTQRNADAASAVSHSFDLKIAGRFDIAARVSVPTPDDDSFFIRIDSGEWTTWNDIAITKGETFEWRNAMTRNLNAGPHTIEIAPREDGALIESLRIVTHVEPGGVQIDDSALADTLPTLVHGANESASFQVYRTDGKPVAEATIDCSASWIQCEAVSESGPSTNEQTYVVKVDWDRAPRSGEATGTVKITVEGQSIALNVRAINASTPLAFAEVDRVVSMEAEHFSKATPAGAARWQVVPHLGRTGDGAVTVAPATTPSVADPAQLTTQSPALQYDFTTSSDAREATLHAYCLPGYRIHVGRGMRYAVAIDDAPPQVVDFADDGGGSGEHGNAWNERKLRNIAISQSQHAIGPAGMHTLKVWMVDPNVVLDKLVLDLGGLEPSELGPAETRRPAP